MVITIVSHDVNEFICTNCHEFIRTLRWFNDSLRICFDCREKLGLIKEENEE
jgi:hypothetical protein